MMHILEACCQDLRFGIRVLRQDIGFSAAVIITVMLGIGANAALFSVIDAVLLRPLPYRDPDRILFVAEHGLTDGMGAVDFLYWREHLRSFESLAAFSPVDQTMTGDGDAVPVRVVMFSESLSRIFGVRPALGRDFVPEEVRLQPGGPPRRVAIISDTLFRQRFGGDLAALGRILVMNNVPYVVIGILPPNFRFQPPSALGTAKEADAIVNMPFDAARFQAMGHWCRCWAA